MLFKNSLHALFLILTFMTSVSSFAAWKLESIQNTQVQIYYPEKTGWSKNINNKRSLMINLHGCSQKAEDLMKDGNWVTTADEYDMVVAIPRVPNGGVIAGCWDYYGGEHTRTNKHNGAVLTLVSELLKRSDLNIDPRQVYVSGLSSGGGESMILGCLAPEIFAGIGLNAGPSTGTSSTEISRPKTSMEKMRETCLKLSGTKTGELKTQLASIIYGNNDFIVSPQHNLNNAEILKDFYLANTKTNFNLDRLEGTNKQGTGTLYSDSNGPRISVIMNQNLGHNWPAGHGGNGGNFINKKSINYPRYLAEFFSKNNRRASDPFLPELLLNKVEADEENKILANGLWRFSKINVAKIEMQVRKVGEQQNMFTKTIQLRNDNSFELVTPTLMNGHYIVEFLVHGHFGLYRTFKRLVWIGEVPGALPPQLINLSVTSVKGCLTVKGQAIQNGEDKISGVHLILDEKEIAVIDVDPSTMFHYNSCSLPHGEFTLKINAKNENELKSAVHEYSIKLAQNVAIASVQEHMEAGRLSWSDYGFWFEKYGSRPFTLTQKNLGQWLDEVN